MSYKLVIFDFDGTLADTFPWFLEAMRASSRKFHIREVADSEVERLRSMETREILKFLKIPWWKLPAIAKFMRTKMNEEIKRFNLFEGVRELIEGLHDHQIAVAVVSSNSLENVQAILGKDLVSRISYFSCGSSLNGKTSKFKKVMKLNRCLPHETICIGDETRDVDAAKAAGAVAGSVCWGYSTREALERKKPDFLWTRLQDLSVNLY